MKNRSLLKIILGVLTSGLLVSCMGLEDTVPSSLDAPEINNFEVKDNGSLVFELNASVDKSLAGRIASCGFYYGKDKSMSGAEKIECRMLGGSFSADLTLREYGQTFYVCSYISNGTDGNEVCSEGQEITVKELEEYVEFGEVAVVSYDRENKVASVNVQCNVKDGIDVTLCGLCYGASRELTVNDIHVEDKLFNGNVISVKIPDCNIDDTYYVRPYLYDGDEMVYGEVETLNLIMKPTVTTSSVTNIRDHSATCGGNVSDDGGSEIISKGIVWSTSPEPTISLSTKTNVGKGMGEFSSSMTGLNPKTIYYVRAYATNSAGTSYGSIHELTTDKLQESLLIDALKFPNDTQVCLSGVVAAVTSRGFLLSDKDANMLYVYAGNGWERNVEVGNTVNVIGNLSTYYNNRELMMESVVVTGASFVPTSDAIRLTSANLSEFASAGYHPCKIEVTGELIYDSPFYEIVVSSSPVVVGLTFPVGDMTSYVGKIIKLTGYYLWTSISPSSETVVSIVDTNITII